MGFKNISEMAAAKGDESADFRKFLVVFSKIMNCTRLIIEDMDVISLNY